MKLEREENWGRKQCKCALLRKCCLERVYNNDIYKKIEKNAKNLKDTVILGSLSNPFQVIRQLVNFTWIHTMTMVGSGDGTD